MLNAIIHFSIKNKFIVGLSTLALIVWGVWSATKLPVDAVPDITNNQVQIITICPTLAGQEVEQFVTYPIEQAVANLPDVEELRSISRFGLSVVTIVFADDVNPWFARQLVGEKLDEAVEQIPPGIGTPAMHGSHSLPTLASVSRVARSAASACTPTSAPASEARPMARSVMTRKIASSRSWLEE